MPSDGTLSRRSGIGVRPRPEERRSLSRRLDERRAFQPKRREAPIRRAVRAALSVPTNLLLVSPRENNGQRLYLPWNPSTFSAASNRATAPGWSRGERAPFPHSD
ncbi:hypothetical protein KM043_004039 [Ampulex compressa]|nr:hypothetical protein KM043_004039 [Ampulex compressa]